MFFTETTFHTDCKSIIDNALSFKIFLIHIWVISNDNIRIQDTFRVKDSFDATIDFVRFAAPFHFNKWCHHATCTMFGFQRTTETRYAFGHFFYQISKILSIFRVTEVRCDVKVNITRQSMTKDYTTVYKIVFVEQFGNHFDTLSEIFDLEAHVLCNNSGAFSTLTTNDWQDAFTDSPPRIVFYRVLRVKTWEGCWDIFQLVFNESQVLINRFFRVAFSLEQDGTRAFRHFTNEVRHII